MVDFCYRFFLKIGRKWREDIGWSSKITVMVALLETVVLWVLAVLFVASPASRATCVNETGAVVVCSENYLVNQSVMIFTFSLFFFFSVFQGIFHDNLYDLYAAMFQACFITGWAIFRFLQPYVDNISDYVFLILTCVCQVFYFVVAYSLRTEYVWRLYRKAGADTKYRRMYKTYLKWLTLFKLDAAFSINSVLLAGGGVVAIGWRGIVCWATLATVIIYLIIGYIAVRREIVRLTVAWFFFFPLMIVFVVVMGVDAYYSTTLPGADYTTRTISVMFYITGSVTVINRLLLTVFSARVYRNYKQGLRKLEFLNNEEGAEYNTTAPATGTPGGDFGYVAFGEGIVGDDDEEDDTLSVNEVIKATYANLVKNPSSPTIRSSYT